MRFHIQCIDTKYPNPMMMIRRRHNTAIYHCHIISVYIIAYRLWKTFWIICFVFGVRCSVFILFVLFNRIHSKRLTVQCTNIDVNMCTKSILWMVYTQCLMFDTSVMEKKFKISNLLSNYPFFSFDIWGDFILIRFCWEIFPYFCVCIFCTVLWALVKTRDKYEFTLSTGN